MTLAAQDGDGHSVQSTSVSRLRAHRQRCGAIESPGHAPAAAAWRTHARAYVDSTLARRSLSVFKFVLAAFGADRKRLSRTQIGHPHRSSVRRKPGVTAKYGVK